MRIFGEDSLLFTPDVGRVENQGDLEYFPSIYVPINSDTYELDGIRPDGSNIDGIFFVGTDVITGLTSFWELNEQPSGTRLDSHSSNDLSDNNTVTSAAGLVSNAAVFDDANSEYLRSDSSDFDTTTSSFTICTWVYFDNYDTTQSIVTRYNGGGGGAHRWALRYIQSQNRLEFQWKLSTIAVATAPSTGAWHMVVAWYDAVAEEISIQVDLGTIDTTSTSGDAMSSANNPFLLGASDDNGIALFLEGMIDQTGFWTKVLSADERSYLYNSGAGRSYAAMTAGGSSVAVYTSDSWSNTDKAALITTNTTYDLWISGSDINPAKGTFSCLYRADYDYDDSDIAQRQLLDGDNFIQIYYDYAAEAFYGQLYSGAGYTELIVSGANQTFVSGTWLHIAMTYDNAKGLYFFVSGTLTDAKSTIWNAETAPANLSIGHISGSGSNSGQGAFDDIRMYKENLTIAEIYRLSNLNFGLN
jgi:hypothetical protein